MLKRRDRRRLGPMPINSLIPNMLTVLALSAGMTAIRFALQEKWEATVLAIVVAAVLDGLDGRMARLLKGATKFGAELNSLSDFIAFGVAPAFIVYLWSIHFLGGIGWVVSLGFAACCALRLARFNTQMGTADKRYFQGLPCPPAAAVIAGLVWLATDFGIKGSDLTALACAVCLLCGLLMVSNIRFLSFKDLNLRGKVPFVALLLVVAVFVFVSSDPPLVLFSASALYALHGPVLTLVGRHRRRAARRGGALSKGERVE